MVRSLAAAAAGFCALTNGMRLHNGLQLSQDPPAKKQYPVSKVVKLLESMRDKLEEEANADQKVYDKFQCWCKVNSKDKAEAVKEVQAEIQRLTDSIEEGAGNISRLAAEVKQLKKQIEEGRKSLETAQALRDEQSNAFHEEDKELTQSISALKGAIVVLGKRLGNAEALIQKNENSNENTHFEEAALIIEKALRKNKDMLMEVVGPAQVKQVESFLTQAPDYLNKRAPGGYQSQSGEVFGILKNMLDTFKDNQETSKKEEEQRKTAFDELKQAKNEEIATMEKQQEVKEVAHGNETQKVADAKVKIEKVRASQGGLLEFLEMAKEKCAAVDRDWAERSKMRAEEMQAVSEAITALADDASRDLFSKVLKFVQVEKVNVNNNKQMNAFKVLSKVGKKFSSPALKMLAQQAKVTQAPNFDKVFAAIDKMAVDLKEQQQQEMKDHDSCVTELQTNEMDRTKNAQKTETLGAKVEGITAAVAQLDTSLEENQAKIDENNKQMEQEKKNRDEARADFQESLAEHTQMQKALNRALTVLKNFYEKKEAKFLQVGKSATTTTKGPTDQPPPPGDFKAFKKSDGAVGVVSLLTQILTDAKAMQKELETNEKSAEETYEAMAKETTQLNDDLQGEITQSTIDKAAHDTEKQNTELSLKESKDEGVMLMKVEGDLHGKCDFLMRNFELRQTARTEEIEALKQAKAILSGADFAVAP